jgi:hypothetical protein
VGLRGKRYWSWGPLRRCTSLPIFIRTSRGSGFKKRWKGPVWNLFSSGLSGVSGLPWPHTLCTFFQAARADGMSDKRIRRKRKFWILLPLQALYAAVSIPICMLLSLGDLEEEPNNHLVIARKPTGATHRAY